MNTVQEVPPGREADVRAIRAFTGGALTGGGSLLVTGPPGCGKSVLLEVAARHATAAGARVLRVAGRASLGTADYSALDQLLGPLHVHIQQLPGPARDALLITRGVAPGRLPGRLAISAAVLALLRRAGRIRPLLVLVEDSHRLDQPTALVLAFAARRLTGRGAGVALLAEARTLPARGGVFEGCGLPRHRVGPLGDDAAATLLAGRHPGLDPRARARVVAEAAGNPLILLELAAALDDRPRSGPEPLPAHLPLGPRLEAALRSRAADLPGATRELLLLAALSEAGDLGRLEVASRPGDVLAAIAPAERAGAVSVDGRGRRVTFTHPVYRTAIIRFATDLERRRAHQTLAAALSADPIRQTRHFADAADGPDDRLAERLRAVAEAAIAGGEAAAAGAALVRSAELSTDPRVRTRRMLEAAFIHADVTGDLSDAARLLGRARAADAELADSLPIQVVVSHVVVNGELPTDVARPLLAAAIDAHPRRADATDDVLIDALHLLMLNCWTTGTPDVWEVFERAFARLRPGPPPVLEMCARSFGDATRLAPDLLRRITAAAQALRTEFNPVVITRTALACVYTDRLAACQEPLRRVLRQGRVAGGAAQALQATVSLCIHHWFAGQWAEVTRLAADGLARSEQYGYPRYRVLHHAYHPALVAAGRGDVATVHRLTGEMTAFAVRRDAGIIAQLAHHVRAIAAIGQGDFAGAYLEASAISPAGVLTPYTPNALWVLLELVEGAVRSGRPDAARAHADAMTAAEIDRLSPRLALVVAGCQAMAGADPAAYERALAVPGAERWPFELARVRLAYGEHLRRRRDHRARGHLMAASEIFQRLGAGPWIRRAERDLRATGRSSGTGAGSRALSAQEAQVAELAATGSTNKEIGDRLHLSHRTVSAHLYRIFPKLGITSRAGLRDALRR